MRQYSITTKLTPNNSYICPMKNTLLTLLLFTLCTLTPALAQSITVKGLVVEAFDGKTPIVGAFIKMNPKDTLGLKKAGRVVASDYNGVFTIMAPKADSEMEISFMGYTPQIIKIPAGKRTLDLGKIQLKESGRMIDAAVVKGQANIAKITGDTMQYNAAAFKTHPDATTEDLLKKMPGVSVGTDGSLETGGKKVTKVVVNGKAYFEDDPSLALKSLPSDAVESVQMFEDKTDDAKFSGFDDGQRVTTINIVTKRSVLNAVRGKVYAGYGTDSRYAGGAGINWMTDNHRLVFTMQSNNVNNQDFTLNDISSSGGSGGRWRMSGGGTDLGAFSTSAMSGIRQTNAVGLNYSGEFGDKWKLSASYFFNGLGNDQSGTRIQDYLTMPRYYSQETWSKAFNYNHRFNAKLEWNPSETDRITFQPRFDYTVNHGASYNAAETYAGYGGDLTNKAVNNYNTKLNNYNISGDLWWQHRFAKAGRTLSLGGTLSGQKSWGDRTQNSFYTSRTSENLLLPDSLHQVGNVDMSRYALTGSATYVEPISERSRINVNYMVNYDRTISDRRGWNLLNYDKALQDYELQVLDTTTTNYMSRNYTTQTASLGYSYTAPGKLNIGASLRYQYAQLNNFQDFPITQMPKQNYGFSALLPSVFIRYTPNKAHALNFNYNTNSRFPSINQLQDILDISNILQVSKGDPNLRQSYNHSLSLFYNFNNVDKNITFRAMGSATFTQDYIANHRRFLTADTIINGTVIPNGAQYTSPVNLNGYMNANLYTNVTLAVKPLKTNMTVGLNYNYTRSPSVENYQEYLSNSNALGLRLQTSTNIADIFDISLRYDPQMRLTTSGSGRFDRYYSHNASLDFTLYLWKGFYLRAEGEWRNSFGTQESYSQHFGTINASIAQSFFKNKVELKISAYDLLNQNRSMWQSTTDTYTQTTTSNVLKRYFMASITWRIDTRPSSAKTTTTSTDGRPQPPMHQMGMPMMRR